jgi:V/A-type H+-transporting ATPase subunit B
VTERRYLDFATAFEQRLIDQGPDENRSLDDTLTRAWDVLSTMPERELTMINPAYLKSYHHGGIAGAAPSVDEDEERPR